MSPVEARQTYQRLTEIENALVGSNEDAEQLIEEFKNELFWIWHEETLIKAFNDAING
jgi:hypothetical protein